MTVSAQDRGDVSELSTSEVAESHGEQVAEDVMEPIDTCWRLGDRSEP